MKNKIMQLVLTACVCLSATQLSAWQRTAMDDCKTDMQNCKKSQDACQMDMDQCKKNAATVDEASFASELSTYSMTKYQSFTPAQKKMAMDYADNNSMSPDDAVAKVMSP